MQLMGLCVVLLFFSLASGDSTTFLTNAESEVAEKTQEEPSNTSATTNVLLIVPETENKNDMDPEDPMEDLLLFESLMNEEKVTESNVESDTNVDKDDIVGTSATVSESRVSSDNIGVRRRQGELNPDFEKSQTASDVQYDDSVERTRENTPSIFGQRVRSPNKAVSEETPMFQLTQGGYRRPYEQQTRFRNRQISRPDSSEQSKKVEEPDKSSIGDKQPESRRIVPQVTYSNQPPAYDSRPIYNRPRTYGPEPILRTPFQMQSQSLAPASQAMPMPVHNGLLNAPPAAFLDYTPPAFRAQFPPNNEIGYAGFGDPSNAALYQSAQTNPFQNAALLFQGAPPLQNQPIFVNPGQNMQPQFQFDSARNVQRQLPQNSLPAYPNFDNVGDNSRANFAPYFSNPNANPQFQVPPNFYGANLNEGINAFNNPPINFMANYPNPEERYSSQFFRYPATTVAQNEQNINQQNANDQQTESDTSQEDKKTKLDSKEDSRALNDGDLTSLPFGTRLPEQNEGDFFIRYPTNEAGYAVRENLPPQNGSEDGKDNSQRSSSDQRSFPSRDPYTNALNSVRNQRQNRTRQFVPEQLFRDVPLDFGYPRPQNQIFSEYPEGNRDVPRYPMPNFDPRGPFNSISPISENEYPFLNAVNQRSGQQKPEDIPMCAKQSNASFCFEDNDYPKRDILYSINSNSYLMDRLSGPTDLNQADSMDIPESRNASNLDSDQYSCAVDIKSGTPLRAKNLAGSWRFIVNTGRFLQPLRMEVCRSEGNSCSYVDSRTTTSCEQKFSLQRLLTWSQDRGIFADVFKIPVACTCRILQAPPA